MSVFKPVLLLSAVCAMLITPPIQGQDQNAVDENQGVLEEIIVTATKRSQSLKDVPFSVEVLQGSYLEEIGAINFADFAPLIPSLDFNTTVPGQNRLSIRGVSALDGVSSVGIYMDDTPVTSRQETQLDAILYDLERVEVLRGPQGTLYGEGSIGGTIIFVTNKPDSEAFASRANIEASSIKGGDNSYAFDGMINLPLSEDKAALRIVAYGRNEGG